MWLDNSNLLLKSGLFLLSDLAPCFLIHIWVKSQHGDMTVEALLDTGASACLIDKNFAKCQNLTLIQKAVLALVEVMDG
jgi:predicted aspartyl protease